MSEGQAQSQESNVNTTSDVIAKQSLEGEALAFLAGSGGMLPRTILKTKMLRYAFSALLGVFKAQTKDRRERKRKGKEEEGKERGGKGEREIKSFGRNGKKSQKPQPGIDRSQDSLAPF